MRAQIEKILNQSKKLQAIINVDDKQERKNVIEFLNGLSADVLTEFQKRLEATEPEKINKIRLLVVKELLAKQRVSEESVEAIKAEVEKNYDTNILHSWKSYFSLFLPLLYTEKLDSELIAIARDVISKTDLDKFAKYKTVDFDGANNFGADRAWIAIYNNKQSNQSSSLQLFIEFSGDQVTYGLRRHSEKGLQPLKQIFFSEFQYDQMISDLRIDAQAIVGDTEVQQPYRVWKISHGKTNVISDDDCEWLNHNHYISVGYDQEHNQRKKFLQMKQGDYFYLVRNQKIVLFAQIDDEKPEKTPDKFSNKNWVMRKYKPIKKLSDGFPSISVDGKEGWKPQNASSVNPVPEKSMTEFEAKILKPAFDLTLNDLNNKTYSLLNELTGVERITMSLNQIFYGPPGTGKTFNTVKASLKILENSNEPVGEFEEQKPRFDKFKSNGQIAFVTFHQSFSYEDFVEGIRAESNEGKLSYPVKDGVFKKLVIKARENQNQPYVLIIDEINRGNTSKIFGELITLIEKTKRAGEVEAVELTLPYSGKPFSVPNNLYIIGTMNTADRSLALIDTALRRRFDFIEMMPRADLIKVSDIDGVDIKKLLTKINERIEALYDREHTIGHAFFMKLTEKSNVDELAKIFRNNILPLLEEYFFEDWEKISQVLGKSAIYEEHKFSNLGPDFESLGKSYRRVDEKLKVPSTYQAIYQNASVDE